MKHQPTPAGAVSRRLLLAGAGSLLVAQPSWAQAWPARPVAIVVPFPPGNTADLIGRALAEPLRRAWGQPVVVENRVGAAGNVAMQYVARAPADGHTLLLTASSPFVINPAVYRQPGFDAERDFVAVALLGSITMMLIANPAFAASTVAEFVRHLAQNPGRLNYASVGAGTFTHLGMEMLLRELDAKAVHVPYRGAAAAHSDLIGGQVDFMFDSIASANAQRKGGRIKAIAVSSGRRSPFAPDVPALADGDVPALRGFDVSIWAGLFAPAGTPAAVVGVLNAELNRLLRTAEFRSQLAAHSIQPADPIGPAPFGDLVRADMARWGSVARSLGLQTQ